jgi:hypothetical protein|tara:strand:- start:56 stop:235 length:180 start_codon:yes stop_codon:yes gene_type:complete
MIEQYENEIAKLKNQLDWLEKLNKKTVGIGGAKIAIKEKIAKYENICKEMYLTLEELPQ